MAKAKKLPSGNWRVQASATVNGKTIRKSFTSYDKKKAELSALEWQNQLFKINSDPSQLTLGEAIQRYIDNRRNILSPVTIATYEKLQRNYFTSLQPKKISTLTQNIIQSEINELCKTLSPKSVRSIWGLMSAVIKDTTHESISITLPQKEKKIYATPNRETSLKILSACKGTEIELPVTLALRLGLRISEICGLKWSAVNDEFIIIDNAIVSYDTEEFEKTTKETESSRKIPLPKDIKELIDAQPKINDYVVQKNAKAIGAAFRRMLIKHNIPHCRFHDLRHATASAMALLNVPDKYAMKIGGWKTPEVLHSIYQQTFTDEEIAFAKLISEYFTESISHEIHHE